MGRKLTEEIKRKISVALTGRPKYSLRGRKLSEETKKRISISMSKKTGRTPTNSFQKGNAPLCKSSKDIQNKIRQKAIYRWQDNFFRDRCIQNMKGKKRSPEACARLSLLHKERWKNPEIAKEILRKLGARPTKVELFFIHYFQERNIPYKYVGDGKVFIEGRCPDFIDVNGRKTLAEVGSKKEKAWRFGSVEKYIQDRKEHFSKYGYETEFYWIEDYADGYSRKIGAYLGKQKPEGEKR